MSGRRSPPRAGTENLVANAGGAGEQRRRHIGTAGAPEVMTGLILKHILREIRRQTRVRAGRARSRLWWCGWSSRPPRYDRQP
jgi:hypothetical protein